MNIRYPIYEGVYRILTLHRAFSFGQPCASISCYNPLIPFFTIRSKSGFPSTFTRNGSFYKLSLSSNNVTIKIAFLSVIPPGPDLFFRKGNVRCQDLSNPAVPWMPSRNLPLTSSSVFPSSDLPVFPRHLFGAEK